MSINTTPAPDIPRPYIVCGSAAFRLVGDILETAPLCNATGAPVWEVASECAAFADYRVLVEALASIKPAELEGSKIYQVSVVESRVVTVRRNGTTIADNAAAAREHGIDMASHAWARLAEIEGVELGPLIDDRPVEPNRTFSRVPA